MYFARTEDFFKMFHPTTKSRGSIIMERKIGKSNIRSQISTLDLERISRYACGLPDIYFSTVRFSGMPLLLNFSGAHCLHLQVPKSTWNTNILLTLRLGNKGIPLPTATVFDGEIYTLLWILDTPIESHEFHIYSLLQQCLYEAAMEFNPTKSNLDISFLTRLVGSINSSNNQVTGLINNFGKSHNRTHMEYVLFKASSMSIQKYQQLQIQAGVSLELMSLLRDRVMTLQKSPQLYKDWLIFFGSALCNFCTQEQLSNELIAIAGSLEAKPWSDISSEYSALINSITNTASEGYIEYDNIHLAINEQGWLDLIRGRLEITSDEIDYLELQVLANKSRISPHLHIENRNIFPVGEDDFVPIERLLLKEVP